MASQAMVGDAVSLTTREGLVTALWQGPAVVTRGRWLFDRTDEFVAAKPSRKFVILQLILQSSTPPNQEARADMSNRIRKLDKNLVRIVSVPVGDALWASIVGTIMRGANVLQGRSK